MLDALLGHFGAFGGRHVLDGFFGIDVPAVDVLLVGAEVVSDPVFEILVVDVDFENELFLAADALDVGGDEVVIEVVRGDLGHHVSIDRVLDFPDRLAAGGVRCPGHVIEGVLPLFDRPLGVVFLKLFVRFGQPFARSLEVFIRRLPGLLTASGAGMPERIEVGVVSDLPELSGQLSRELENSPVVLREFDSLQSAQAAAEEKKISGYIKVAVPPQEATRYTYFSRTGTDVTAAEALEKALGTLSSRQRLEERGVDPEVMSIMEATPELAMQKIGKRDESSGVMTVMFTSIGFVMLLYMTVLLYGQMIGRSVVQEKTNKTVEIMLSSVRPWQLMYGKIAGIGFAGLLQYAVWFLLAGLLLTLLAAFGINTPELIDPRLFATLLIYFIPAFLLYAAAFAAIGAASEDEQHLGQLSGPLILFLIIPLLLLSPIVMNPGSLIALVLSYFPFTAPVVMFIRVMVETPGIVELFLSYTIVLATIGLVAGLGGKVFRIGILLTGKRPSIGEVLSWLRRA